MKETARNFEVKFRVYDKAIKVKVEARNADHAKTKVVESIRFDSVELVAGDVFNDVMSMLDGIESVIEFVALSKQYEGLGDGLDEKKEELNDAFQKKFGPMGAARIAEFVKGFKDIITDRSNEN